MLEKVQIDEHRHMELRIIEWYLTIDNTLPKLSKVKTNKQKLVELLNSKPEMYPQCKNRAALDKW